MSLFQTLSASVKHTTRRQVVSALCAMAFIAPLALSAASAQAEECVPLRLINIKPLNARKVTIGRQVGVEFLVESTLTNPNRQTYVPGERYKNASALFYTTEREPNKAVYVYHSLYTNKVMRQHDKSRIVRAERHVLAAGSSLLFGGSTLRSSKNLIVTLEGITGDPRCQGTGYRHVFSRAKYDLNPVLHGGQPKRLSVPYRPPNG